MIVLDEAVRDPARGELGLFVHLGEPAAIVAEASPLDGYLQARILEDGTFSMVPDTADGHCTPAQLLRTVRDVLD